MLRQILVYIWVQEFTVPGKSKYSYIICYLCPNDSIFHYSVRLVDPFSNTRLSDIRIYFHQNIAAKHITSSVNANVPRIIYSLASILVLGFSMVGFEFFLIRYTSLTMKYNTVHDNNVNMTCIGDIIWLF